MLDRTREESLQPNVLPLFKFEDLDQDEVVVPCSYVFSGLYRLGANTSSVIDFEILARHVHKLRIPSEMGATRLPAFNIPTLNGPLKQE